MRLTSPTRAASAVLVSLIAVLSGSAVPAAADEPGRSTTSAAATIDVRDRVGVQADGAGVVLVVDLTCDPSFFEAYVEVVGTQVQADGDVASAYGSVVTACTGSRQRLPIAAVALDVEGEDVRSVALEPGSMFVSARAQMCSEECDYVDSHRTVTARDRTIEEPVGEVEGVSFELLRRGRVEADGAAALVRLRYSCDPGVNASFYGGLAQVAADGFVAVAGDQIDITCSATNRAGVLAFHAAGAAWRSRPALLVVNVQACADLGCVNGLAHRNVRLR